MVVQPVQTTGQRMPSGWLHVSLLPTSRRRPACLTVDMGGLVEVD